MERTRDPCEIPWDIKPLKSHIDSQLLKITWDESVEGKPHESQYDLDWLIQNDYSNNFQPLPPPNDISLIEINYKQIMKESDNEEEGRKNYLRYCHERLSISGAVIVRDRGMDTEEIINDYLPEGHDVIHSHFGRYEDLRTDNTTNKNTDQLGYTNAPVYPHTDQPFIENPPGFQMLHCISPADVGGENFIIDAGQAIQYLKGIDYNAYLLLTTTPVTFHRKQKNFESITKYPLIELKNGEFHKIRYSYFTYAPFNLPFDVMEDWYKAYIKFANIVRNRKHQYYFILNKGDYLIYNNFTMLHGRETFQGGRHLRGVYFSQDSVFTKLK